MRMRRRGASSRFSQPRCLALREWPVNPKVYEDWVPNPLRLDAAHHVRNRRVVWIAVLYGCRAPGSARAEASCTASHHRGSRSPNSSAPSRTCRECRMGSGVGLRRSGDVVASGRRRTRTATRVVEPVAPSGAWLRASAVVSNDSWSLRTASAVWRTSGLEAGRGRVTYGRSNQCVPAQRRHLCGEDRRVDGWVGLTSNSRHW